MDLHFTTRILRKPYIYNSRISGEEELVVITANLKHKVRN